VSSEQLHMLPTTFSVPTLASVRRSNLTHQELVYYKDLEMITL